ncbi:helix-turn-helix domain-containing protein [Halomonas sp. WWR20]
MQNIVHHIAVTLRTMRSARGWSLDRAARETGVSKAMLGQIERGESSPTVATLWKIASGFHVSFSQFIEVSEGTSIARTLWRDTGAEVFDEMQSGMRVVPLFPFDSSLGVEMFLIELMPGACSESAPHEVGVVEHVIVIDGTMELYLEGEWRHLQAGDGVRFAADQPHGYRNRTEDKARFHNVIHYSGPRH